MSSEVADQLHILHNPFADTTSQPKIPDGKVNHSLGFQTRSVKEYKNDVGESIMHMILFAGQNAGLIVSRQEPNPSNTLEVNRGWEVLGYTGSNNVNFTLPSLTPGEEEDLDFANPDNYALWRVVSSGLQLKLLNAQEEDDGWWEAIRISDPVDLEDYFATTVDSSIVTDGNGCLAPVGLISVATNGATPGNTALNLENLVNDPSYSTGLLRDLHQVQFDLHGRIDYHDFIQKRKLVKIPNSTNVGMISSSAGVGPNGPEFVAQFAAGYDDTYEAINQFIDPSYDMIYIRLHCRDNTTDAADNVDGSRFHCNVISNQEIYFDSSERENRFHTKSESVGTDAMSIHFHGRRDDHNAASLAM